MTQILNTYVGNHVFTQTINERNITFNISWSPYYKRYTMFLLEYGVQLTGDIAIVQGISLIENYNLGLGYIIAYSPDKKDITSRDDLTNRVLLYAEL